MHSEAWLSKIRDPAPWMPPRRRPKPVVAGDVVVRSYEKGDGPRLFDAISAGREALLPWMAWATTDHRCPDDSIHFVERTIRASERPDCLDFPLAIVARGDGSIVGGTGFHRIRPDLREAEIGYWVRGDRQRAGICTRAIGALISSALTLQAQGGWGFRRILIFNAVENVGSRRVCERLGLRLEMRMRRERYLDPVGYHDTHGFAVLADEWDFAASRAKPGISWDP